MPGILQMGLIPIPNPNSQLCVKNWTAIANRKLTHAHTTDTHTLTHTYEG